MEEEKAIELAEEFTKMDFSNPMGWTGYYDTELNELSLAVKTVLNMLKEKDKEIEHQIEKRNNQKAELAILNEKQKEMNKLINTVKSYKGQMKKETKRIKSLEKEAQGYFEENIKKDKMIDLIIDEYEYNERINLKDFCEDELRKDTCIQDCKTCIKQYFEQKSDKRRLIAIF